MRRAKKIVSAAVLAAAAASTVGFSLSASGATLTWTGTTRDPNSALYTLTAQGSAGGFTTGQNLYLWNTSVANWSSGGAAANYTVGDDVVFTDNFTGGTVIRASSGNLNPSSMTFTHVGSGFTTYNFIAADFLDGSSGTGGAPPALGASTVFGTNHSTILTLDSGFNGKVIIRPRSGAGLAGGVSAAVVKSGILEISDGGALPNTGNNNVPLLTLDGGQYNVNVNTGGNTGPASTQLTGTLSVLSNSLMTNGAPSTVTNSRLWGDNGTINVASGATLTVKSLFGSRADIGAAWTGSGTVLLQDVGGGTVTTLRINSNFKNANGIMDLGNGASELVLGTASTTFDIGALYGGANTKLTGNTGGNTATFSIGARGESTTFSGVVQDNGTQTSGLASVFKVGAATLTLAGANTSTGTVTANAGTLVLTNSNMFSSAVVNNNGTMILGGSDGALRADSSSITLNRGGVLRLDNSISSNNDRLVDNGTVSLQGGTLEFVGNLASSTAENAGALVVTGASSTVKTVAAGSGSSAGITFSTLNRSLGGGVVDFQPAAGVNVNFTSVPSGINGILGAFATVNGSNWGTLSGGAVSAYVHSAGETDSSPAGWTSTQNINLTAGGTSSLAGATTINSLRIASNATVSINAGQSLTLTSGGLLAPGTSGGAIVGAGTLTAGTGSGSADLIAIVPDAANTLTITAPIANNGATGTVSLIKAGPGKLVLGTSGSYTGGVRVYGGTLTTSGPNLLPSNGALIVDFGNTFDLGGFNEGVATVSLINGSIVNSGGAATLTGTAYDVRQGTVSAVLAGTATLTKTVASTVTLSSNNTYTGGTVIGVGSNSAGVLATSINNALPVGGSITINTGTLNIGATNQTVGTMIIGNAATSGASLGTANLVGTTGVITSNAAYTFNNGTIAAILSGPVGLNKTTTNNGTITSVNTYTGVTTLSGGVLNVTSLADGGLASSIGQSSSAAANLFFAGGQLTYLGSGAATDRLFQLGAAGTINSSGTGPLVFSSTAGFVGNNTIALGGTFTGNNTFNPSISGSQGLLKTGAGLWILGQANTYTGNTTVSSGTLDNQGFNQNIANLTVNGGTMVGTGIVTGTNYDIQSGRVDTVLAGGAIPLTKSSTGVATLNANNTFTGTVSINAGTLSVPALPNGGVASPLGASPANAGSLILAGGTLMFTGPTTTTDRQFTLNGNSAINASGSGSLSFSFSGAIPGNGGSTLTLGGTNTGANTFPMIHNGTGGLVKADGGQWVVTAVNTYSGITQIGGGTLTTANIANGSIVSGIGQSSSAATNLVFSNGALRYNGSGATTDRLFTLGVSTLSGNGTIDSSGTGALQFVNTGTVVHAGTVNRTLGLTGSNTGDNKIGLALVDGAGSLLAVSKAGSGKWILSGNNSYSGLTTVSGGTLQLASTAFSPVLSGANGANITSGRIVFDYTGGSTPAGTIEGLLTTSYGNNGFNNTSAQIRSTSATNAKGLGWLDDGSNVHVAYTYYGDANLSGNVDLTDFTFLASNFNKPSGATWQQGDFNYDDKIDLTDFTFLAANFNKSNPAAGAEAAGAGGLGSVVPEPATLGLLACGFASVGLRRRRRALSA